MGLLAQIANTLGPYVKLHKDEVVEQVLEKTVTEQYMTTLPSDVQEGNTLGLPVVDFSEVWQGFQPEFNPKGTLKSTANPVTQRRHKINIKIEPDKVVGEWEGYLYDERKDRLEMPLVEYIVNKVPARVENDRETRVVWFGKYEAPTPAQANPAVKSVDGIGYKLAERAVAADTPYEPFAMGDYDQDSCFDYVEAFFGSYLPQKFRFKKLNLFMSETSRLWYLKDKRNTFAWMQKMEELLKVDFSNINIVGLPSMGASKAMFATLPGNMIRVIHKNKEADNFDMQKLDYTLKLFADVHMCYGLADWRCVFSNDQDLDVTDFGIVLDADEETGNLE